MNEWASKLLSPLQGISDRNKADFDQFIVEVNNDQLEQMYFHKELNVEAECRPTFDQLSIERIVDETQKTLATLKSLETILGERYGGFSSLNSSLLKARASFEGFETTEGTLKLAADAFYIFSEQESAQSKQQIFLSDLKTSISQIRYDAQRKLSDYQKEISNAERDVATAEKKLGKSKEAQEKGFEYRNKLEAFELDGLLHNVRGKSKNPTETKKELDDMAARLEKDVRDDIQHLLAAITKRDQVLSASRRAFQKLNRDCKRTIFYTLRKIVDKEKDFLETRRIILEKFEQNVAQVDIESDLNDFIDNYRMEDGGLSMQARALSLLEDLSPQLQGNVPSSAPSPSSSTPQRVGSFADSPPPPNPPPLPSAIPPTEATPSSAIGKRSGSLLGGALSAMSSMINSSTSTSSSASTTTAHHHFSPHMNFPTGTIISPSNNAAAQPSSTINNNAGTTFPSWEFAAYLSQVFYDTGETSSAGHNNSNKTSSASDPDPTAEQPASSPPSSSSSSSSSSSAATDGAQGGDQLTKTMHRRARVQPNLRIQFHDVKTMGEQEFVKIEANRALSEAVEWLVTAVQTKRGRDSFMTELNQFRSRKVELGGGFDALGVVLWKTLSFCQDQNDVHNSKIIMMLSQTFYRFRPKNGKPTNQEESTTGGASGKKPPADDEDGDGDDDDDEDAPKRGVEFREYIKEKLMGHPIWEDGNFWEQALWQCAIEQLQTIPYEKPWYEMEKDSRNETVRRVHDVLFSQVMAIIHSMMELGCQQRQTREFLYRMCVVHQLTEGQRQQLLAMVLKR